MASFGYDFQSAARRASPRILFRTMNGWKFGLSFGLGGPYWHLTAELVPTGRGSTLADWSYLGEVLALVGVPNPPERASLTPEETTHPNAIHHWTWKADGSHLDEDCMATIAAAFQKAYSPV